MLSIKSITGQMISTQDQDIIVLYDTQGNQLVAIPKEQIDWSLRVLDNGEVVKEDGFTDRERYLRSETPPQQFREENRFRQEEDERVSQRALDLVELFNNDPSPLFHKTENEAIRNKKIERGESLPLKKEKDWGRAEFLTLRTETGDSPSFVIKINNKGSKKLIEMGDIRINQIHKKDKINIGYLKQNGWHTREKNIFLFAPNNVSVQEIFRQIKTSVK